HSVRRIREHECDGVGGLLCPIMLVLECYCRAGDSNHVALSQDRAQAVAANSAATICAGLRPVVPSAASRYRCPIVRVGDRNELRWWVEYDPAYKAVQQRVCSPPFRGTERMGHPLSAWHDSSECAWS